jgi:hypothetical protein
MFVTVTENWMAYLPTHSWPPTSGVSLGIWVKEYGQIEKTSIPKTDQVTWRNATQRKTQTKPPVQPLRDKRQHHSYELVS